MDDPFAELFGKNTVTLLYVFLNFLVKNDRLINVKDTINLDKISHNGQISEHCLKVQET